MEKIVIKLGLTSDLNQTHATKMRDHFKDRHKTKAREHTELWRRTFVQRKTEQ